MEKQLQWSWTRYFQFSVAAGSDLNPKTTWVAHALVFIITMEQRKWTQSRETAGEKFSEWSLFRMPPTQGTEKKRNGWLDKEWTKY